MLFLLAGAGVSVGQTLPDPSTIKAPQADLVRPAGEPAGPLACWTECCPPTNPRCWASAEYLFWSVQNAPVAVPLVTTNLNAGTIGSLSEPGTVILYGAGSGQDTGFRWFSGVRVNLGGWLDDDQIIGIEGDGFLLEKRTTYFNAFTPGSPTLAVPFNATEPFVSTGGIANPAGFTSLNNGGTPSAINVGLSSRLWGAEANGLVSLYRTDGVYVAGIVGFRYLDLFEKLTVTDAFFDQATGSNGALTVFDSFGTRNQFYGAQIGARVGLTSSCWIVETTAKVAFGSVHEVMNIAGTTSATPGTFGGPAFAYTGGTFAQPSNIGQVSRNNFAVVPEVQVKLGCQLTTNIRPYVAYDFLYISSVARPGAQVDTNVNPTQNAAFTVPGVLVGVPAPLPVFHSSSFWAQGINFGVQVRY
jgi:hypothetical protein